MAMATVLTAGAIRASAQQLEWAEITFETTSNDKDHDTLVDVQVLRSDGYLAADKTKIAGHFNNNSAHKFRLAGYPADTNNLTGGNLRIVIFPNGNDKWAVKPTLTVKFVGQAPKVYSWGEIVLTQDDPEFEGTFR